MWPPPCTDPKRWTIRNRRLNVPCLAAAEYSATLFQQNILLGEAGDVIRSMMSYPAEYSAGCGTGLRSDPGRNSADPIDR